MYAFDAAQAAVEALPIKSFVVRPGENLERNAGWLLQFNEPPSEHNYEQTARVLLLAYEDGAGANLQAGCHHAVLFAPYTLQNDPVASVSKEQQSIGRLKRWGQQKTVVVHRIVLEGPHGEETVETALTQRNRDPTIIRSATNVGE